MGCRPYPCVDAANEVAVDGRVRLADAVLGLQAVHPEVHRPVQVRLHAVVADRVLGRPVRVASAVQVGQPAVSGRCPLLTHARTAYRVKAAKSCGRPRAPTRVNSHVPDRVDKYV